MHRFYLLPGQCKDNTLLLTGDSNAAPCHPSCCASAPANAWSSWTAVRPGICSAKRTTPNASQVKLTVSCSATRSLPLPYQITLLQAIPKGKIIESIIQKATELGAWRIVPLLSDRVVTQLDDESGAAKAEKWRQTAIEAVKQCGSAWLLSPQVEAPITLRKNIWRARRHLNCRWSLPCKAIAGIRAIISTLITSKKNACRKLSASGSDPKAIALTPAGK